METNDTTNNTSISSGVSLDIDEHGLARTSNHHLGHRSNHPNNFRIMGEFEKECHVRCADSNGESFDTFGESFMMDSFANGDSFASNYEPSRYQQQRAASTKLMEDLSSILVIEEECEDMYAHDETGNYTTQEPTENIRLNFSSVPNTFTDPRQITHG